MASSKFSFTFVKFESSTLNFHKFIQLNDGINDNATFYIDASMQDHIKFNYSYAVIQYVIFMINNIAGLTLTISRPIL